VRSAFYCAESDKNMRRNDHAGYVDDQSFGKLLSHSLELI